VVQASSLDATLWLKRKVKHPRVQRVEYFGALGYGYHFRLERPEDVDRRLRALVREAYRIGKQESRAVT
jgi:hypothetical protein